MDASSPAALLLVALVVALAGCTSPPAVHGDVGMSGVYFLPPVLRAGVGQPLVWANNGTLAHTVTADDGSFDSGQLLPEQKFTRTFTAPGTYPYHCTPHSSRAADGTWEGMVGTVVVT